MWCYILRTLLILRMVGLGYSDRGRVYMVTSPESVVMPINDETSLNCEMNLQPDRFEWRHYPLPPEEASNPHAPKSLSTSYFVNLPQEMFTTEKKSSALKIKSNNKSVAGDYQCLAYYGASVVASVPGRITITSSGKFPPQNTTSVSIVEGNTVLWKCEPPESNPPAVIDYYKNGKYVSSKLSSVRTNSLILPHVGLSDSGTYKCFAYNNIQQTRIISDFSFNLRVDRQGPRQAPKFITSPKMFYVAKAGESIFVECSAYGNPVPQVSWSKSSGELPRHRIEKQPGGLLIRNISSYDDGVYICNHTNSLGTLLHHITLVYNEPPTISRGPQSIDTKEGENMDLECIAKGIPEPEITWFLNGVSVLNDSLIEAVGSQIYFRPVAKRHAGILQCFAKNSVGITYSSANMKVFPKQISSSDMIDDISTPHPAPSTHRKRKHKNKKNKGRKSTAEMVPPSKPTVSRLSDESVMVRWSVPENNGLPIQFFKVQYKELGPVSTNGSHTHSKGSRWKTTNADIAPHIRSYEVNSLKPDHIYRFRIAAVYSNNDNKLGPNSARFALTRADFLSRNPLPIPTLTHTEAVNDSAIRIYWECTPGNESVDGFFVNYLPSDSAGDYMKATVDGASTRSYVVAHLQSDTMYDIKLQSFNSKSASEFSPILKQKTAKLEISTQESEKVTAKESVEATEPTPMYIFIAAGAAGIALLLSVVVLFIICRKLKQKKDASSEVGNANKDDPSGHHIQADSSDYIVSPKNLSRVNGCAVPGSRITITSNPLADADNKNQTMIEMSCLPSQNNNCSQPSGSNSEQLTAASAPTTTDSKTKNKIVNRDKNKRNKLNVTEPTPGENYV